MQCTTTLSIVPRSENAGPCELEYQERSSLSEWFLPFVNNADLSDVTLLLGDEQVPFHAHKTILAMRSEYFKKMFTSSLKESSPNCTITKPNISPAIFSKVLVYLYGGKVRILNEKEALKLMIAGQELQLQGIVDAAVHYLQQHITMHNVCPLLELAKQHYVTALENICTAYIATHARRIFCGDKKADGTDHGDGSCSLECLSEGSIIQLLQNDALALDEIDVFRGVMAWGKMKLRENAINTAAAITERGSDVDGDADGDGESGTDRATTDNTADLQSVLEKVVPHIRFFAMNPVELLEVESTRIVPQQFLYSAFKHLLIPHLCPPSSSHSKRRGKLQFEESLLLSPDQQNTLAQWHGYQQHPPLPSPSQSHRSPTAASAPSSPSLPPLMASSMLLQSPSASEWQLCYRGSRDGFSSSAFHSRCDDRPHSYTVILVETHGTAQSAPCKYLMGGFTSCTWNSWGIPQSDPSAFLFSFGPCQPQNNNGSGMPQLKLPVLPMFSQCAVMGSPSHGPIFGAGRDLEVDLNHKECSMRPHSFGNPPAGAFPQLSGNTLFTCTLIDIEVFCLAKPRRASVA